MNGRDGDEIVELACVMTSAATSRLFPRGRRWVAVVSCVCALLALSPIAHGDAEVAAPHTIRAAIVAKALLHLKGGKSSRLRVALMSGTSEAARADVVAMATAWRKLGELGKDMTLELKLLNSTAGGRVTESLSEFAPDAVYIPVGADVAGESRLVGNLATVVVCGDPTLIRSGCSLSIELAGRRPRIVLFPADSAKRGIRWAADLVQLARVVP